MKKKLIFLSVITITFLSWGLSTAYVRAEEDDEEEDEDEDEPEQQFIPEAESLLPSEPEVETPPEPAPTPEKIQSVNKIIKYRTVVPPIIIFDTNENGITDDLEKLYQK